MLTVMQGREDVMRAEYVREQRATTRPIAAQSKVSSIAVTHVCCAVIVADGYFRTGAVQLGNWETESRRQISASLCVQLHVSGMTRGLCNAK